ncbi:MAG TPA: iron-sulfur cluster assembly accessory protein [Gammaproteobacteria bacterium]|nr:iron-sulfur cluster assembly accessory protein [Gammaproteobacteria bacterium]
MITLSASAIEQIKQSSPQSDAQGMALRLAAKINADENIEYGMGFDEARDNDAQETIDGIHIVIAPDCVELLNGTHMDYVELEPGQHHFIFLNPNDPNYKPPTEDDVFEQSS